MALKKRGKYYYGDSQSDIRQEIARFKAHRATSPASSPTRYAAVAASCFACGSTTPRGRRCESVRPARTNIHRRQRRVSGRGRAGRLRLRVWRWYQFEITVGVALYDSDQTVKWLYVGCRCPKLAGYHGRLPPLETWIQPATRRAALARV